jgi:hypothetical protein
MLIAVWQLLIRLAGIENPSSRTSEPGMMMKLGANIVGGHRTGV